MDSEGPPETSLPNDAMPLTGAIPFGFAAVEMRAAKKPKQHAAALCGREHQPERMMSHASNPRQPT